MVAEASTATAGFMASWRPAARAPEVGDELLVTEGAQLVLGELSEVGHWNEVGIGLVTLTNPAAGGTIPSGCHDRLGQMAEISIKRTGPSARFALPSDRRYLVVRHVWASIDDGIATVG